MPYTKIITVYTRQERNALHRMGYWIDRDGNRIPVVLMSYNRLSRLVRTLSNWAAKESDPIAYLKRLAIFPHVANRMLELGLHLTLFDAAICRQSRKNDDWINYVVEPSLEELQIMNISAKELEAQFT